MARIARVEDDEATGELAELVADGRRHSPRGVVPEIMRTLSLWPDFLRAVIQTERLHFSDGYLSRAQHEMIASYVAALPRCHY